MRNKMKKIALILFLFSINLAQAEQKGCKEVLRDAGEICNSRIKRHCGLLENCLTRRDTCVREGVPETKEQCTSLNKCMKKYVVNYFEVSLKIEHFNNYI